MIPADYRCMEPCARAAAKLLFDALDDYGEVELLAAHLGTIEEGGTVKALLTMVASELQELHDADVK